MTMQTGQTKTTERGEDVKTAPKKRDDGKMMRDCRQDDYVTPTSLWSGISARTARELQLNFRFFIFLRRSPAFRLSALFNMAGGTLLR